MTEAKNGAFNPAVFLASAGLGRRIVHLKAKGIFFSQGGQADSIYYIQKGRAKLTVVSKAGKEATITLLSAGDFIGEESIQGFQRAAWPQAAPSLRARRSRSNAKR